MHKKDQGNEKSTHKLTNESKIFLYVALRISTRPRGKRINVLYQSTLMKSTRTAIARSLWSPPHNKTFSIIADPAFTEEIQHKSICNRLKKNKQHCRRWPWKTNFQRVDEESVRQRTARTGPQQKSRF